MACLPQTVTIAVPNITTGANNMKILFLMRKAIMRLSWGTLGEQVGLRERTVTSFSNNMMSISMKGARMGRTCQSPQQPILTIWRVGRALSTILQVARLNMIPEVSPSMMVIIHLIRSEATSLSATSDRKCTEARRGWAGLDLAKGLLKTQQVAECT